MFLIPNEQHLTKKSSAFHWMCSPFYSLLKMYIRIDRSHKYESVVHGSSLTTSERSELFNFRVNCYEKKAKYLVPTTAEAISKEKIYDENAYHSIVRDRNGDGEG